MKFTELRKNKLEFNLQLFTDGGEGGADQGASGEGESTPPANPSQSFTVTQEELSAQVNQAVMQALQAQQTEAQRLASMTETERAQHQEQQRENALQQREQEIARKELRIEAVGQLATEQLPAELIDLVVLDNAEACSASIKAIKASFNKAVDDAVQRRLVSSAYVPGAGGGSGNTQTSSHGERLGKQQEEKAQAKSNFFKK